MIRLPPAAHVRTISSDPTDQDIRIQYALSWIIVVSEWRSVTAVSLNVGGGVHLIKPVKLYMCTQKHYKHNEDGRMAPGVRVHEPYGERRYENWITTASKTGPEVI